MPKLFSISLSISVLPSIRCGQSFKSSSRPARLMLAVLGGFVLMGLWLFVIAKVQSSAQAAASFQSCDTGVAVIARTHPSTGTSHDDVITAASDPLCIKTDLRVAKTLNTATPQVGETIAYTVTVTNNGPDDATGVQLTDVLPGSVTFGSVTPQDSCTETDGTVICDLGSLPNDATATVAIVVTPTNAEMITNMASVTGNEFDPDPDNNTAEKSVRVAGADLIVTKTVNITAPNAGDVITYTVMVANNGPDDAIRVRVTDALPAGVTFGGYAATQGIYTSATGLWDMKDDLPDGMVATLTITATVNSCSGHATITNTANISSADPLDPITSNNEARVVITLTSGAYCLYLPILYKEPTVCSPYGPEDHLLTRQTTLTAWPIVDYANRYTVEVKVPAHSDIEYGLIFGHVADPTYYRFGIIYTRGDIPARFRLKWQYGSYSGDSICITENDTASYCGFADDTINPSSNHLKVECDLHKVKLYLNTKPDPVWESDDYYCNGGIGIFLQSPSRQVTGSFRDFQISCPSDASCLNFTDGSLSPLLTIGPDSDLDD